VQHSSALDGMSLLRGLEDHGLGRVEAILYVNILGERFSSDLYQELMPAILRVGIGEPSELLVVGVDDVKASSEYVFSTPETSNGLANSVYDLDRVDISNLG
jgi:hypothetical protein